MKKIFYIYFIFLGLTLYSVAATRGDVMIMEASEDIRFLSQKIVKNYLFLYKNPQKRELKEELTKSLDVLSDKFRMIATTTKDGDTKDVLEFLAYSKDQIALIFGEKLNEEQSALMLDYSETLLEGADSIASGHSYDVSEEEKMLMTIKKMEYLLERITKYYMAVNAGFKTTTNKEQMKDSIHEFEESLAKVNLYDYPYALAKERSKVNNLWKMNKVFFDKSNKLFIPNLLVNSVLYLENIMDKIALYHSKNQ